MFRIYVILGVAIWAIVSIGSCGGKNCDSYGRRMTLQVPISTSPRDTFILGDTLWFEASFNKNVDVLNHDQDIYLEEFDFFTEVSIIEISDTIERFLDTENIINEIGQADPLQLQTALAYAISYVEDENGYHVRIGFVLEVEGLFYFGADTETGLYKFYDHAAVFECDNVRRAEVRVNYSNSSTSEENYSNLFRQTNVDYLLELVDYDRFATFGGHAFVVTK
jgi:hypothetical protein